LLELDAAGTVTHYSPLAYEYEPRDAPANLVGCNLFRDVKPVARVTEFRDRFQVFLQSPLPTEVFNLTFSDSDNCVHARITMVQADEPRIADSGKLILVRVVKV
jgi:hypothetical protein